MKKELRREMIKKRLEMSKEDVEEKSNKIMDKIINILQEKKINNIMLYFPIKNEVSTEKLALFCFERGIGVIYPKSIIETYTILPCQIKSFNDLEEGEYGIPEPKTYEIVDKKDIDIVIVPGVAFSRLGYRLGYGAGYYDRFLSDYKGTKIGVCYAFQICDSVFNEVYDVKMDAIVTELEIFEFNKIK
ncbi:MAG: 5-formyltetrahydrofolate cyclo-ligase [Caloramator sp.]|nr:5-formyltetrahydrofolate cyclo-ligase [Caloramator sp.]